MKRISFLLIGLVLFLVACGSNELDNFVKDFNENASTYDIPKLIPEEFGEIDTEENMSWKQLYESRNYKIDAKYKDGENISGYYLVIEHDQPYEKQEGVAYNAGVALSETIKLNVDKFVKEFETALTTSSHTYTDGDYRVEFFYPGASSMTSVGMIINFDKK